MMMHDGTIHPARKTALSAMMRHGAGCGMAVLAARGR
eukprot:SAG22_NODE_16568_length_322_cov_1.156951_1_plen_36_part_01